MVERGAVTVHELARRGRVWHVAERPDLDAMIAELGKSARSAKPPPWALEYEVKRALEPRDVPALMTLLDRPEIQGSAGAPLRTEIWRALVMQPIDAASQERFLTGLRDEDDASAHAIGYRLYVQKALAPRLVEELGKAWANRPRQRVYASRLCHAIREWPDFPRDSLPRDDPELDRELSLLAPESDAQRGRGRTRTWLDELVTAADTGALAALRPLRDRLGSANPSLRATLAGDYADRLLTLASRGEPATRAAVLEVLELLDVDAARLAPHTDGLPPRAGLRELRHRARPRSLPLLTVDESYVPPRPAYDWRDVLAAATTPRGDLVVSRTKVLSLVVDGKTQWRFTAHGEPLALFLTLGHGLPHGRNVVFVGSKFGIHCLDAGTGRELWCNRVATHPQQTGSVVNPEPRVWALPEHLWFIGAREAQALDWETGELVNALELPTPNTHGFAPHREGAMVVDGPSWLGSIFCHDRVPTGLVIRPDGSSFDQIVPRGLSGIERILDDLIIEVSAFDLRVERDGEARDFGLPLAPNETLEAVGRAFHNAAGAPSLELAVHVDGHFGVARWIAATGF